MLCVYLSGGSVWLIVVGPFYRLHMWICNDNHLDLWDMSLFHSSISVCEKCCNTIFKWFNCFTHGNTWRSRFAWLTTHTHTCRRTLNEPMQCPNERQTHNLFTSIQNHLKLNWSLHSFEIDFSKKKEVTKRKKLSFLPKGNSCIAISCDSNNSNSSGLYIDQFQILKKTIKKKEKLTKNKMYTAAAVAAEI